MTCQKGLITKVDENDNAFGEENRLNFETTDENLKCGVDNVLSRLSA